MLFFHNSLSHHISLLKFSIIAVVERIPNPEMSRNCCVKPVSSYPTRLSVKFLISMFCLFHIQCAIFEMSSMSPLWASSENCCPINYLAKKRHIPLKYELKKLRSLANDVYMYLKCLLRHAGASRITWFLVIQIFITEFSPFQQTFKNTS